MNRAFVINFKHWWSYLNPWAYRSRRVLQAYVDLYQDEFLKRAAEEYNHMIMYGCSISHEEFYKKINPDEFYGTSIVDEIMKQGGIDELERPI